MLEQLDDDAVLEFAGIPVGPFTGKDAIESTSRRGAERVRREQ